MKTIKARVHMLPTEDITCIHKNKVKYPTEIKYELSFHKELSKCKNDGLCSGNQHLYITTDEEIKEGDWVLIDWRTIDAIDIEQCESQERADMLNKRETTRKIIASTDPKLIISISKSMNKDKFPDITLPQISQSFIEEYCKAGGIDEVLVEYELNQKRINPPIQLKLNPDNTIIIHPVEEKMYSREEVINLIERFNKERCGQPWFEDDDKWIEENL